MQPWLVLALVFVATVVAALLAQRGLASVLDERRRAGRRFAGLQPDIVMADDPDSLRRRVSRLGRSAVLARMERLIVQSGTSLTLSTLAVAFLVITCLLAVALPLRGIAVSLGAGALVSGLCLTLYIRIKRARRLARFGEQLPEVIDVIVRSLRAGHPLPVSLALVARDTPEPAGPEFALVVDEVNYGRSLTEALENLYARVGYPELRFFVASTSIASQTGGNLGDILSRLARMLRERFRLTRRVRALTAEGRFSGYALSAMPIILFGVINVVSASYYAEFWASPVSSKILLASLGLLVIGNLIIFRLVNFKI